MTNSFQEPGINPLLKYQYAMLSDLLDMTKNQSPALRGLCAALHYLTFRCQATTGMNFGPDKLHIILEHYPLLAEYRTPDATVPLDLIRIEREAVGFTETSISAYPDDQRQMIMEQGPGRWLLEYYRLKNSTE